ncbi:hypothetical protein [Aquamicrobium zhengzhouense]|uniref:DUF4145 domain-containing protein n=1 Tax=Aquamicrobium zhengzhouense TaxID=2781738 RepID=A0ABS0SGY4_9HYPH|nr:hypothetical protein [Aquamicrobium zhengzhouense]MBI1622567.1 hypothetical protein [Aquamicrobium zhengzhouense]
MLSEADLKQWLHKELKQLDKLLLILATFDAPAKRAGIRERAANAGLTIGKTWNPSASLRKSKGLAIRVPEGWELTDSRKACLRSLGVTSLSSAAMQVATDLRAHLDKIINPNTRAFVEEAIKCHQSALYRSAIVMSWLAAVDILHRVVVAKHLAVFNASAKSVDAKWKDAVNEDGVGRMGEEKFLERCAAIGVLGKNQKDELLKGLKLRNGCGHPNSLKVGPNAVANHIEILLLNVFEPFQV